MKNEITVPPIQSAHAFCQDAGIAPITLWRYRKKGWIETLNIAGRQYVTAEAIAEFKRRALCGEFAKVHKTPRRVVDNERAAPPTEVLSTQSPQAKRHLTQERKQ